jgi:hypothetical protein
MAKNLREKIPTDDVLMIQDVNTDAVKKFVDELSGFNVIVADNARAIAERSVRLHYPL